MLQYNKFIVLTKKHLSVIGTLLIILTTTTIVWLPIFKNYFHHDDWSYFSTIIDLKSSPLRLSWVFVNEHFSPILLLIKYLQVNLFRLNIIPYLITQLILFMFSGILLMHFLKQFFQSKFAIALGFLFLINPAYYEIVSWSSTFGFLLAFIFTLLSLIFIEKYLSSNKPKYILLTIVFASLSSLSSATGYLSIIFLILFYLLNKKEYHNFKKEIKKDTVLLLPILILGLILGTTYLYLQRLNPVGIDQEINLNPYALIRFSLLGFVLGNILPFLGLSIIDRTSLGKQLYPINILYYVLFLVTIVFLFIYFHKNLKSGKTFRKIILSKSIRLFLFASTTILLSYIFIAIPRTWVGIESFIFFGRYHLFASIGLLIISGLLLENIGRMTNTGYIKRIVIIPLLAVLTFCQFYYINQVKYFRDERTHMLVSDYQEIRQIVINSQPAPYCLKEKGNLKLLENIVTFGKPVINFGSECSNSPLKQITEIQNFYRKYF